MDGLIGKKIGMSHMFRENGSFVPISLVEVELLNVTAIKTIEKDGYKAVQIGIGERRKPSKNKSKKAVIKELRIAGKVPECKVGDSIGVDIFQAGDYVDVTGTSKGKGFQGGMKRWGWKGGEQSHGSMFHRRVGSIGASSYPSRVHKGKTMPGHMGSEKKTLQNLEVVAVEKESNLLILKGGIPGAKNSYVIIRRAKKKKPKKVEEKAKK